MTLQNRLNKFLKSSEYPQICSNCKAKIYGTITPAQCPKCGKPWPHDDHKVEKERERELVPVRLKPKEKEAEVQRDPRELPDGWYERDQDKMRRWKVNKSLYARINKFLEKVSK
jgi:hypothetical protein